MTPFNFRHIEHDYNIFILIFFNFKQEIIKYIKINNNMEYKKDAIGGEI